MLLVLLPCFANPAVAANKYWVGGGTTTNAPTSGIWQTTTPIVWSDGAISGANAAWVAGDTAYFGGANGTYAITIGGAISGLGISFRSSGYTLSASSAQTISMPSAGGFSAPQLRLEPGVTATIGTNVTVQNSQATGLWIGANGANVGGTLNLSGKVAQNSANTGGLDGSGTVVNVLPGGSLLGPIGSMSGGYVVGRNTGADCTVNVSGGTFGITSGNTTAMTIGGSGTGTVNVVSGNFTMSKDTGNGIVLGSVAGIPGILNLNGGVTTTPKISMGAAGTVSVLTFNGGTLRANFSTAAYIGGLTTANVRNGGAMIDSAGFGITINQPLQHSTIAGDAATDGGLTKLGVGSLTLAGINTYNGMTTVSDGTLAVSGSIRGPVVISPGGNLASGTAIGPITISNSLALAGTITLRIDQSAGITNDFVQGVTSLTCGGRLTVILAGGSVSVGDVFTLFKAGNIAGGFNQFTLPTLPDGLAFDTTQLTVDGTLRVVAVANLLPSLNSTPIGTNLLLSWNTLPLRQYQLITTTNLAQPRATWSKYGPPILSNGDPLSQITPKTNSAWQFFSVAIPPLPIDPARLPAEMWKNTQWNDPGGWTTIDVSTQGLPPNNTGIDASLQLSNIIATTSGRRRLYFPPGTYYFRTSYFIHNNNIWIDGAGASNTVFQLDAPGSANMQMGFSGSRLGSPVSVAGSIAAGDTTVTLADASAFAIGDIFQLYADNAPLTNGGLAFTSEIYSQNLKVMSINGNTLTADMKVLLDYPASYTPLVQRYRAVQNVKLSRLKIARVNQPTLEATYNYGFFYAYNCAVVQVESSFAGRDHFKFQNSKDCVIESNYVHDCWVQNTGGYGYGITLVSSTGCRISNNKLSKLRHHFILSGCHNVVSYNSVEVCYDYNDIGFHAAYAYMNLVEGNMFTESYADTSKDGWPNVEPTTGPGNMWFRNYASGKVGSIQSATRRQNVIGNIVGTLVTSGSDHYMGANLVAGVNKSYPSSWTGGTTNWGVFSSSAVFPASLYLASKPAVLGNTPWPAFGPGVANWGVTNVIPARAGNPAAP
jgi:autotransporter-associated beta strand protein